MEWSLDWEASCTARGLEHSGIVASSLAKTGLLDYPKRGKTPSASPGEKRERGWFMSVEPRKGKRALSPRSLVEHLLAAKKATAAKTKTGRPGVGVRPAPASGQARKERS